MHTIFSLQRYNFSTDTQFFSRIGHFVLCHNKDEKDKIILQSVYLVLMTDLGLIQHFVILTELQASHPKITAEATIMSPLLTIM